MDPKKGRQVQLNQTGVCAGKDQVGQSDSPGRRRQDRGTEGSITGNQCEKHTHRCVCADDWKRVTGDYVETDCDGWIIYS